MKDKISIKFLEDPENVSDEELQGMVDLYKKNKDFTDEQRKERGLDAVKSIKEQISNGVEFVIATDENGKVVAARKANEPFQSGDGVVVWLNSLFVDPDNRRQGIASLIEEEYTERAQVLVNETRQLVILAGGIEPDNIPSQEAHREWGYEIGEKFGGEGSDGEHEYFYTSRTIEPIKDENRKQPLWKSLLSSFRRKK